MIEIQMKDEWEMWQRVCAALRTRGIDVNDSSANPTMRAIEAWGEVLVALRMTQSPAVRADALANALANYRAADTV